MRSIWLFICRLFSFLYMRLSGYKYWSYLYRAVWERKFRKIPIIIFENLNQLIVFVGGGGRWRKDSWRALFDAVSSPQRVQQIFAGIEPQPETDLDCDDYMSFTAEAIDKSIKAGFMVAEGISRVFCFTVMWMKGWVATGHNVVLLEHLQTDGTFLYSYMDYAGPSVKKSSKAEVAKMVRVRYGSADAVSISWCVAKPDMTPVEVHWG